MDQVVIGMMLLRPHALSPAALKALIHQRGWRMADAAVRWNIRPETLSRIAADPARETRWDDMVRALPTLTRRERAATTAARLTLYPSRPRPAKPDADQALDEVHRPTYPVAPFNWTDDGEDGDDTEQQDTNTLMQDGFRYQGYVGLGSELAVVSDIGSFAPEGSFLMVIDTRLGVGLEAEVQEEYLCESRHGTTLWLTPDQMDDWVVSTGKTRQGF